MENTVNQPADSFLQTIKYFDAPDGSIRADVKWVIKTGGDIIEESYNGEAAIAALSVIAQKQMVEAQAKQSEEDK